MQLFYLEVKSELDYTFSESSQQDKTIGNKANNAYFIPEAITLPVFKQNASEDAEYKCLAANAKCQVNSMVTGVNVLASCLIFTILMGRYRIDEKKGIANNYQLWEQ